MGLLDQVTERKIEINKKMHNFYCDGCGTFLGASEEYDDGYYHECGGFELKLHTDKWYAFKKHYCDNCRREFLNKLNLGLKELGFYEE